MRYEYAYDCMNRLVRKTASGKMLLENRYDLNGNRIGRKDISGKETVYEYDHLDRMSKVVDNGHESVIYQYNDNGTIKKMITGGMIITEYTYDAQSRLTRVVTPKGSEDYTYDRAGNRLSRILRNNDHSVRRHETYAYDAANRLLERNVAYGDLDTTATGTVSNAALGKPEAARTLKTEY